MSGTMIAQVINLLLNVVLYKYFYDEIDNAEFGLFSRIIGVVAAVATARYEFAIPIAKADVHSFRLYRLALRLALVSSGITGIIVVLPMAFQGNVSDALFFALIPFGMLLTAYYSIGTNWAIRNKQFRSISFSKVTNAVTGGFIKLGFGWMGAGYIGLILGTVVGLLIANVWFFRNYRLANNQYGVQFRSMRTKLLAKTYQDFPKVNLPHTMMDAGRDLIVALLIVELFTKSDFGYFNLSYSMLRMPLMLAGLAISQVFFQRCSDLINRGEDILPLVTKSVKWLTLISIVPFGFIFFFGDELFVFVFSEEWRVSGELSQIMALWFMFNFIASPISFLPLILKKQKAFFKMAMFGSISMILSLLVPEYFFQADIKTTLWSVSITQAIYFVLVIFKTFDYLKQARLK